ncbi:hypothetical protein DL239_18645 [Sedimentitalea sp. CY04]|uniref:Uncharacterized protein n=1 Tax=Parasedimentitalea denitrificans TaxID=2211118 RepID=A0ABX0WCM9_9RHOB|nr:hypothetical protein [Sedimentitalea sp. CY04]NIZ62988.1 hypothetical protein [Sedimentitalea sp. CY04]
MSDEWRLVSLSNDKTILTVKRKGGFLDRETEEAMESFYRILSQLTERISKVSSEEDKTALRNHFRKAVFQFEKSF